MNALAKFPFLSVLIDILLVAVFVVILSFFTKFGLDRALLKIGKAWLALACALVIGLRFGHWPLADGLV